MTDDELLVIAKKHEAFLLRLDSGEIETALNMGIDAVLLDASPTAELVAGVMASVKQFIFGSEILPDIIRIKEAAKKWDGNPTVTLADM
jgi:hypothetical protein